MCVKLRSQLTQKQFTPNLKQFTNNHHISEHRTTQPFRTEKAVTNKAKVAADTYVTLARCERRNNLESGQGISVPERARGHCTALPVTTCSRTIAHWTAGDHMYKLSPSRTRRGSHKGCPFGLIQGFALLATLESVQVHLSLWYPLHINNFTLNSTNRNKQSKRSTQK